MTTHRTSVPLSELYLHPINPRQVHEPGDVVDKARSLRSAGLIQNLACYADPQREGLGVVAGGLRLAGFQMIAEDDPDALEELGPIDCLVTDDPLVAQAWAVAENVARKDLSPAQEIRAYDRMRAASAPASSIANAFGVTEAHVRRRLKLADLPDAALDALEAREITLDVAQALTTAQSPEQAKDVLQTVRKNKYLGARDVRRMLHEDSVSKTDRRARFVGIEPYELAGGIVDRDLFDDNMWLRDVVLLDKLFAEKLDAAAAEAKVEGWAFVWTSEVLYASADRRMADVEEVDPEPVELPAADQEELERLSGYGDLADGDRARLEELETRARGSYTDEQIAACGVMLYVNWAGKLTRIEGLMPRNAASADGISAGEADGAAAKEAPPALSEALTTDLRAIALRARQAALLGKTELALDLLAFQLSGGQGWGHALALSLNFPDITPSIDDGLHEIDRLAATSGMLDMTAAEFAAFQALGKKHRNEVLTNGLARQLQDGRECLRAHLNAATEVNPRAIWTPTAANLFNRVKGPYLDRLADELLHDADTDRLAALRKMKVKEKAREFDGLFNDMSVREAWGLSREQAARIDAWLPDVIAEKARRPEALPTAEAA